MDRSSLILFGITAATLVLAIATAATFPTQADLAPGWHTPIIAAELARTPADLAFLAGPDAEPLRAAMDAGHRFDTLFPFAYGSLLFVSAYTARAHRFARVGMICALLSIGMDLRENAVLTEIVTAMRAGGGPESFLGALFVATWAKWGAIAVALATIEVAERAESRGRAVVLVGVALLAPLAMVTGSPALGEAMALGTVLGFGTLVVRAWQRRHGPPGEARG